MICIVGRVLPDGSIEESSFYNIEDNFGIFLLLFNSLDMFLMNEMIINAQKYPVLFANQ